jgi:ubiquinone/menaquinone biosynthesis C-methylase UbiE
VTTILGGESDPGLPRGETDIAVMVEVFHHLTDREGFLKAVRRQLKPGGKMIIVEATAKTKEQLEACHTDPHQSRELAEQAGFTFQRLDSFVVRKTQFFALVLKVPDTAG